MWKERIEIVNDVMGSRKAKPNVCRGRDSWAASQLQNIERRRNSLYIPFTLRKKCELDLGVGDNVAWGLLTGTALAWG